MDFNFDFIKDQIESTNSIQRIAFKHGYQAGLKRGLELAKQSREQQEKELEDEARAFDLISEEYQQQEGEKLKKMLNVSKVKIGELL